MAVDTFTNANGTLLPTHNSNWVKVTPGSTDIEIFTNGFRSQGGGGERCCRWNSAAPNDQWVEITLPDVSGSATAGVAARIQTGAESYYYCYIGSTAGVQAWFSKNVAGVVTDFGVQNIAMVAGGKLRLTVTGTNLLVEVDLNGSSGYTTLFTQSDATFASGQIGVCAWGNISATRGDDFDGSIVDPTNGDGVLVGSLGDLVAEGSVGPPRHKVTGRSVILKDESTLALLVPETRALVTADHLAAKFFEGRTFVATLVNTALGAAAFLDFHIVAPSLDWMRVLVEARASGFGMLRLYELSLIHI